VITTLGIKCTDNNRCKLFATPKGTIFIYGGYGGKHFVRIGNTKMIGTNFDWVNSMHVTPLGDILIVAGTNGAYNHVLISKDEGVTWKRYFDNNHDSSLYVSPKGTLFVGYTNTLQGRLQARKYVRLSKDIGRPDDLPFSHLSYLKSSPSGNILASATRGQEITHDFISYDDGLTWNPLYDMNADNDLPDDIESKWRKSFGITDRLRSVVQKNASGTYFLVNPKGFYRTVDNGRSWEKPISSYLPVASGEIKILIDPNQSEKVYLNWVEWPDL
jgi:hypothetical protein